MLGRPPGPQAADRPGLCRAGLTYDPGMPDPTMHAAWTAVVGQAWDDALAAMPAATHPPRGRIGAALAMPPEAVRVAIIGQDPYPDPAHAIGMAFAVPADTDPWPRSLRNIQAELVRSRGRMASGPDLAHWRDQGVLLLNRRLTLGPAAAAWEPVTDRILRHLAARAVPCLAWGRPAITAATTAGFARIVATSHPSPLSWKRPCGDAPAFYGSGCFAAVDIDW
jgi:uracil-DNA glycosylase